MALGTTAAIALGIGAAGAAYGVSRAAARKAPTPQAPQALPQPPTPQAAQDVAQKTIRRKKAAQTQSVFTSPLGIAGEADVARKTLLGE